MLPVFLNYIKCPVSRQGLRLEITKRGKKQFEGIEEEYIEEGVLYSEKDWFYPIIKGIPRLTVESLFEYEHFLKENVPAFENKRQQLMDKYSFIIKNAKHKNKTTTESFAKEWSFFDYEKDKTWGADRAGMYQRFLDETLETEASLKGKVIFDAGCGNGLLDILIAKKGAMILAMDLGKSIERAFEYNDSKNVFFIQGDVQLPPTAFNAFDLVFSSGVLHHTNNTELSFASINPSLKEKGKISLWLYTPRPGAVDKVLHKIRKYSSQLPLKLQYILYTIFIFPPSYIGGKLKGAKINNREMMINIFDTLSCEFCWLHQPEEVSIWFDKQHISEHKITTTDRWGFNIIGIKQPFNKE